MQIPDIKPLEDNIERYRGQCWPKKCYCEPFYSGKKCEKAVERKKVAVILVNYNMPGDMSLHCKEYVNIYLQVLSLWS